MNNALKDEQGRDRRSDALETLLLGQWPVGYFHWKDGWYFARQSDGSVHIIKIDVYRADGSGDRANYEVEAIIPPNEWTSIISHVAAGGDGPDYQKAVAFHNGEL